MFKPTYISRTPVPFHTKGKYELKIDLRNDSKGREYRGKTGPYHFRFCDSSVVKKGLEDNPIYQLIDERYQNILCNWSHIKGPDSASLFLFGGKINMTFIYNDGVVESFLIKPGFAGSPYYGWHEYEVPLAGSPIWLHKTEKRGKTKIIFEVLEIDEQLAEISKAPYMMISLGGGK